MNLSWKRFTSENLNEALSESFCLYVYHHPSDGDRPFYIGKAKYFGTKQPDGYKASARYNSGYVYMIEGLLRSGYTLYIARLGRAAFEKAAHYEQELIARWNPIRQQRLSRQRLAIETVKPWASSAAGEGPDRSY